MSSDLELIDPVTQIQCDETGPEAIDDEYECRFYRWSEAGTRAVSRAMERSSVSGIYYGDLHVKRFNDRHHTLGMSPVHAVVFEEEAGCLINTETHELICDPVEEAEEKMERHEERFPDA